jgi:hypothetical protein
MGIVLILIGSFSMIGTQLFLAHKFDTGIWLLLFWIPYFAVFFGALDLDC